MTALWMWALISLVTSIVIHGIWAWLATRRDRHTMDEMASKVTFDYLSKTLPDELVTDEDKTLYMAAIGTAIHNQVSEDRLTISQYIMYIKDKHDRDTED